MMHATLLVVLLSFFAMGSGASAASSSSAPSLCILQLGDSLTQGVGRYPSYRELLHPMLVKASTAINSNNEEDIRGDGGTTSRPRRRARRSPPAMSIAYIGSQQFRCTPKKPAVPYREAGDEASGFLRHEGHCSWGSSAIRTAFEAALVPQSDGGTGGSSSSSSCSLAHLLQPQPSSPSSSSASSSSSSLVSFVMFGHNDAFQVAKLCKLREDQKGSTATVARADRWLMDAQQQQKDGEGSPLTRNRKAVPRTAEALTTVALGSEEAASSSKQYACVQKHLATEGSGGFKDNVRHVLAKLLLNTAVTPTAASAGVEQSTYSSSPTAVLWGLNTPVGFPMIDATLRAVIWEEMQRAEGLWRGTFTPSDGEMNSGDNGAGMVVDEKFLSSPPPLPMRLVAFEGFTPGVDTFDTTHPNHQGALLMAKAWLKGFEWLLTHRDAILPMAPIVRRPRARSMITSDKSNNDEAAVEKVPHGRGDDDAQVMVNAAATDAPHGGGGGVGGTAAVAVVSAHHSGGGGSTSSADDLPNLLVLCGVALLSGLVMLRVMQQRRRSGRRR